MSEDLRRRGRRIITRFIQVGARGFLANVLGLATVTLSIFGHFSFAVFCAVLTLGLTLIFTRLLAPWTPRFRGAVTGFRSVKALASYTLSRTLVALAMGILTLRDAEDSFAAWSPVVFFVIMIVAEPVLASVIDRRGPVVVNAPWVEPASKYPFGNAAIFLLNTYGLGLALILVMFNGPPSLALAFPLFSFGLAPILIADSRKRAQHNRNVKESLREELTAYAPVFVVYWEAAVGTGYQVAMWLPYLEQLGEKYIVVLRNAGNVAQVEPLTQAPIVVCRPMADLDDIVVPSLRAAFYVNNAMRNCHFVRYSHLTHIQLNHGDSDKAPSFNPVMRMYDRNFVAGQAAVDRFAANGVDVRNDFFNIVGRPQVADVVVRDPTHLPTRKTVLYAPTWAGFMADSNYSSLPVGPQLIAALIEEGANVIFRPHPHARRGPALAEACNRIDDLLRTDAEATGAAHFFGLTAEVEMTIFECFNLSDAMISDVSSVVPDYLFSEKPLALVAMNSTHEEFLSGNPIATAAYVVEQTLENLGEVLNDLLGADSMEAERKRVKGHYLGEFGDRDYGQVFIDEARRYL